MQKGERYRMNTDRIYIGSMLKQISLLEEKEELDDVSMKSLLRMKEIVSSNSKQVCRNLNTAWRINQVYTLKDLEEGEVCLDLPFECYKLMEKYFKPYNRIQVPLSTQQFSPTDQKYVEKYENRHRLLGIARDLIVMKKQEQIYDST